ncbi:mitochondrial import inner membrane translocase subunit Tim29 [Pieris napi]|uniref:mitochondrial import inner membrane translocase subunit Tim29 n=1 Tax=Pieris napi TaxID=78633 RepID=UPI001FBB26F4|nr:mitochondrial import inner membrane translocase subunit Tim29 [Pieris napi]
MLRTLKKTPGLVTNLQNRLVFPEKLKGTIIEKLANYWKNLFIDYKQMLQDLRTDIQDDPRKALKWCTGLTTLYFLAKNNPTETDYKDKAKSITNEVILVSEDCRNTKSIDHLRNIQQSYNEGVLHYVSFGIVSFMYTTDLNDGCDLYKAHCSYLQPKYTSILSKISDVGIMGRWWNIFIKTTNFDVKD